MLIEKAKKMEQVHYDIRGPISEEAERMEEQGIEIVKLHTGNPGLFGFEPPAYVVNDLMSNLNLSYAYSTSKGLREAREAIVKYSAKKGILGLEPEDVYTGNGVSELIMMSMQALLNPGDEVLIPTPDYPLWSAAVTLTGGKVVHYLCDEKADWLPDMQDMKSKITSRTKALVIINPNNPTGALYPKALLEEMLELARQHNLLVLSDEIYDRLVMDGLEHTSTASLAPDLPMITYNGLSKSHQICGFRCGWMVVSGDRNQTASYREGLTVMASLRLCSNVLSQAVIKSALEDPACSDHLLLPGGRLYEQRECAYRMLNAIPGVSTVKPKAALYIFPKLDRQRFNLKDDKKLVLDFLKAKHVLITEGAAYNWAEPDHFRLTYLPRVEELTDVINRLGDFLSNYKQ